MSEGVSRFDNQGDLGRALRKRMDDWYDSTSEVYARAAKDPDRWREGLVGYLLRGPGALSDVLAERDPAPAEPVTEPQGGAE